MLLDTHVVLWLLADDRRLGPKAREAIQGRVAHMSAASLWEMAIKAELGKITVPDELPELIEQAGLVWLPVTPAHTWAVRTVRGLPHRDPFDRLLLAQAGAERLDLLTADQTLLSASLEPSVRLVDART